MTDQHFYESAEKEVLMGHIDQVLWSKVESDLPRADKTAHQAKYIQLRAEKLRDSYFRAENLRGRQKTSRRTAFVQTSVDTARAKWPLGKGLLVLLYALNFIAMLALAIYVHNLRDDSSLRTLAVGIPGVVILIAISHYVSRALGWSGRNYIGRSSDIDSF
ncbi:hypothetical protein [Dyella subtropica]|uniref:hypothetical protein n=1 Tax=Dyella subtropica TaxID=2992127 RepID=UPI002254173D|nr:hypothetical protein [Dyella subtropica]